MKNFWGRLGWYLAVLLLLECSARVYIFYKINGAYKPKGAMEQLRLYLSGGSYAGEFREQLFFRKPKDVFRIVTVGGSTLGETAPLPARNIITWRPNATWIPTL